MGDALKVQFTEKFEKSRTELNAQVMQLSNHYGIPQDTSAHPTQRVSILVKNLAEQVQSTQSLDAIKDAQKLQIKLKECMMDANKAGNVKMGKFLEQQLNILSSALEGSVPQEASASASGSSEHSASLRTGIPTFSGTAASAPPAASRPARVVPPTASVSPQVESAPVALREEPDLAAVEEEAPEVEAAPVPVMEPNPPVVVGATLEVARPAAEVGVVNAATSENPSIAGLPTGIRRGTLNTGATARVSESKSWLATKFSELKAHIKQELGTNPVVVGLGLTAWAVCGTVAVALTSPILLGMAWVKLGDWLEERENKSDRALRSFLAGAPEPNPGHYQGELPAESGQSRVTLSQPTSATTKSESSTFRDRLIDRVGEFAEKRGAGLSTLQFIENLRAGAASSRTDQAALRRTETTHKSGLQRPLRDEGSEGGFDAGTLMVAGQGMSVGGNGIGSLLSGVSFDFDLF
ncbi:hypothetical protein EBR96_06730 [bacterium]|nr:hypothetical protein [bacterium]